VTFTDLKDALSVYGIEPVKSDGRMVIRAEDITTALTDRDEDTGDAGDEETGS
jgi:S-DNA-T family DNA segregation ATPase FtsK/SpoIIIE